MLTMEMLRRLDEELAHVCTEAEILERNAPEPAYVGVLLQAINRLAEAATLSPVQPAQVTSDMKQPETLSDVELSEPTFETRWLNASLPSDISCRYAPVGAGHAPARLRLQGLLARRSGRLSGAGSSNPCVKRCRC